MKRRFLFGRAAVGLAVVAGANLHAFSLANVWDFFSLNPTKRNAERASSHYEKGEYLRAASNYSQALEQGKNDPNLRYNLGNSHYKQEDFPSAISAYSQALESSKGNPSLRADLHHNMGNGYFAQGNFAEAVEHYKKALDIDDGDLQTKKNLELAMRQLRKTNQHQADSPSNNEDERRSEEAKGDSSGSSDSGASSDQKGDDMGNKDKGSPSPQKGEGDSSGASRKPEARRSGPSKGGQPSQETSGKNSQTIPFKVAEQMLKALERKGQKFILGRQQTNKIERDSLDKAW